MDDEIEKKIWKRLAEITEECVVMAPDGGSDFRDHFDGVKFMKLLKEQSKPGEPHTCAKCGRSGRWMAGLLSGKPDPFCGPCRKSMGG